MTYYACDIETTGLKFYEDTIRCFGYWSPEDQGCLTEPEEIKLWLSKHREDRLIWHNGKFDQKFIKHHLRFFPRNDFDTMLAAALLPNRPEFLRLDVLVEHFLGLPSWKEDAWKKDIETCKAYCLTDCEYTYKVCQKEVGELQESGNYDFFTNYYMPSADLLARAELRGIRVDADIFKAEWESRIKDIDNFDAEIRLKYKELISEYEDLKIKAHLEKHPKAKRTHEVLREHKDFKFNFNSSKQRQWLLRDKLHFPCEMETYNAGKKKISISTKAELIEDYLGQHPIIEDLLTIAKLSKQEGDAHKFLEAVSKEGKIHTNFNLHTVRTGRLSCNGPNLQQVPKDED